MVKMLTEEHDTVEKSILRELIAVQTERTRPIVRETALKGDSSRRKGKGKHQKSQGKTPYWKGPHPDQGNGKGKGEKRTNQNNWNGTGWNQWSNWDNRQTQNDEPGRGTQSNEEPTRTDKVAKKKGETSQ